MASQEWELFEPRNRIHSVHCIIGYTKTQNKDQFNLGGLT